MIFKKQKRYDTLADNINITTYNNYYDELLTLILTLFKWENLPTSCNERFLEKTLMFEGRAVLVNDSNLGILSLRALYDGSFNVYEEPTSITANGLNYNKRFNIDECVLIRNTKMENSILAIIENYAWRLTNIARTIDTNVNAQKTPVIVLCDEKQKLSLTNLIKKYDGNSPFIFGYKSLANALEQITTLDLNAPYVADKLTDLKNDIRNEIYTRFGINNSNTDKRERLNTDEVNSNNEQVAYMLESMLEERQKACKLANEMWGTNISVRKRVEVMNNADFNDRGISEE